MSTKNSCAEVGRERCDHQFSFKICKEPDYSQGGALTYPLFTRVKRMNLFTRRCDHLPAIHKESDKRHLYKNGRSRWQETHTPKTGGKFLRQPFHKGRGIQSFSIHKRSETNGREIFCTQTFHKRGGISLLTFTHLVIPAALPPITSLSRIRGPITIPRGTTLRRRTLDRATGLSRTGTNTGCTLMHRRWRFGDLFG